MIHLHKEVRFPFEFIRRNFTTDNMIVIWNLTFFFFRIFFHWNLSLIDFLALLRYLCTFYLQFLVFYLAHLYRLSDPTSDLFGLENDSFFRLLNLINNRWLHVFIRRFKRLLLRPFFALVLGTITLWIVWLKCDVVKLWIRFVHLLTLRAGLYKLLIVFVGMLFDLKGSIVVTFSDVIFYDLNFLGVKINVWSKFNDSSIFSVIKIHENIDITSATDLNQFLKKTPLSLVKRDIIPISILD